MRTIAIIGILAAVCAIASGDTITQTATFSGIPSLQRSLTFDSFDTLTGDLDSVSILVEMAVTSGSVFVDNESPLPAFVMVALETDATLSSGQVFFPPVRALVEVRRSLDLAGDDNDGPSIDPSGPDGGEVLFANASGSDSVFIDRLANALSAAQVASFESTYVGPRFAIGLDIVTGLMITGKGGIAGGFTPANVEGTVKVTYNYDPGVPEPASAATLLVCGAWLTWCRRKKGR
jgi:hypothetical protein